MSAEVDAPNVKLQDVVKFIETNNTKASESRGETEGDHDLDAR